MDILGIGRVSPVSVSLDVQTTGNTPLVVWKVRHTGEEYPTPPEAQGLKLQESQTADSLGGSEGAQWGASLQRSGVP